MKNTTVRTLLAVAATAAAAGLAAPAFAETPLSQEAWGVTAPVAQGGTLSRAEVLADLVLWRRAGLDAFAPGEAASLSNPAYASRFAEYQRLRSGPEYLAEVSRQGGGARTVAGQAGTPQTH